MGEILRTCFKEYLLIIEHLRYLPFSHIGYSNSRANGERYAFKWIYTPRIYCFQFFCYRPRQADYIKSASKIQSWQKQLSVYASPVIFEYSHDWISRHSQSGRFGGSFACKTRTNTGNGRSVFGHSGYDYIWERAWGIWVSNGLPLQNTKKE